MGNLTVVILTKNEEHNIADAIKSAFQVASKVVVVDSGSTDKTVELARDNGALVIYHDLNNDFAAQRNFADKCVDTEWVLHLDAVERIDDKLVESIKAVWKDKVHEWASSNLPIITLKGFLNHFVYVDFHQYLNKMNMYSTISAVNYKDKGKNANVIRDIILRPLFAFIRMYILKGGFLDGWLGFVLSLNHANYTLNKYVKLKLLR